MKIIGLTQGKTAIVSDSDFNSVSRFKWQAVERSGKWYARARLPSPAAKSIYVYLHRFILNPTGRFVVDHKNGDGLDNRRSNIRISSQSQNLMNMDRKSGHKGYCRHRKSGLIRAYIVKNGKQTHLGLFKNEKDAAKAYDNAAISMFGKFARLNGGAK